MRLQAGKVRSEVYEPRRPNSSSVVAPARPRYPGSLRYLECHVSVACGDESGRLRFGTSRSWMTDTLRFSNSNVPGVGVAQG